MSSSNIHPLVAENPLLPAQQLLHAATTSLWHVLIAALLGLIVARTLRSNHLHWSWAAVGLAPVVLVLHLLGESTLVVVAVALYATHRGRRWHQVDVDAGVDLAELAADRRTPLDAARSLARRLDAHAADIGAGGRDGEGLVLGQDDRSRTVMIPAGGAEGGRHTLVVGATGSGKTVTQTWLATRAIEAGMGAVVVDPKGDAGMREELRLAAEREGRRFLEWTPRGDCAYNPYATGSETEIADKALAGERFTEPHYMRQAQRYLGHVVRALRGTTKEVSLAGIVEQLDPQCLEVLARALPEAEAQATFAYLDSLTARQRADLSGVRDRLAIMVESDVGPWLDGRTSGAHRLELRDAVRDRAVVYFSLESDRRPLLSQMLGAAIVQDLQTVVAALQGDPIPTLVVIDEFSAVATEHVVRLFGRARSAGFSLLLGTQELSDLRMSGSERLLERVIGNLSVLIAHRQVVPSSAEMIASLAGTAGAWRVSRHSDGRTVRSRGREPVLDPGRVMSLGRGWAAVITLEGGGQVRFTRVLPPRGGR